MVQNWEMSIGQRIGILNTGERCDFKSFVAFKMVFLRSFVQEQACKKGRSMVKKLQVGNSVSGGEL